LPDNFIEKFHHYLDWDMISRHVKLKESFIEKWKNTNQEQIVKDASADLKLIIQRIKALNKKRNMHKKNYIAGAKKYKLKIYAK
jgi:hypothetical protein